MSEEQMRAEFEAHRENLTGKKPMTWREASHKFSSEFAGPGRDEYVSGFDRDAWVTWQAARSHPVAAEPVGGVPDGRAVRADKLAEIIDDIESALKHFTRTPSTLADTRARGRVHEAIRWLRERHSALAASPSPSGAHEAKGDAARQAGNGVLVPGPRLQELQKDAARYRWLRAGMTWAKVGDSEYRWKCFRQVTTDKVFHSDADDLLLDDAIDAAMLPADARKEGAGKPDPHGAYYGCAPGSGCPICDKKG